jgi:hypothetical protein
MNIANKGCFIFDVIQSNKQHRMTTLIKFIRYGKFGKSKTNFEITFFFVYLEIKQRFMKVR